MLRIFGDPRLIAAFTNLKSHLVDILNDAHIEPTRYLIKSESATIQIVYPWSTAIQSFNPNHCFKFIFNGQSEIQTIEYNGQAYSIDSGITKLKQCLN